MTRIAFDIGANIGTKTGELLGAGFEKVVAVEPLFDYQYGDDSRVVWIKALVSDSIGTKDIYPAGTISTTKKEFMEGRFAGHTWGEPVNCPSTTLSQLIAEHGEPDYIKIDVEGAELDTLLGLPEPCNVPLISFEWSSEFREQAMNCVTLLQSLGYVSFTIQFEDFGVKPPADWFNAAELARLFDWTCRKRDQAWGQIWVRK
jgi:FkbM family methyltransferase